jgi:diguanylate cyclase (GGDEF)-like protein/PAS domain S-box-containing protein
MRTQPRASAEPIHSLGRSGSSRIPLFRAAVALVIVYAILDVAWLQSEWGGAEATQAFSDLSAVGCALLATIACSYTWRVETTSRRRPWGILALASAAWASGEIIWSFYELALDREVPFPSLADVGFLVAYPLAALAMLTLPTSPRQLSSRVRTMLDASIVAGAGLLIAWATFLGTLYQDSSGTLLEQAIGLAYPTADVILGGIVLLVVVRAQPGRRTTLVLLALGLLALAVADSAFAYLTYIDEYATGGAIDASWDVGYLLIALAAIRHDPTVPRPSRAEDRRPGLVLPYIAVIIAIALAAVRKIQEGTTGNVLFWGMLAVVTIVVVRQLLTLLDNLSLTRNLEVKVGARTAELSRSEERHRSLVQNSSDVVTIVDYEGVIRYESPASLHVFGYPPERVIGMRLVDLVHPEDRTTVEAYLKRFMARDGNAPVVEWRIRHDDGEWRHCESIGANLLNDPTVAGFVLNTRDISERKELELQLRHQAFHDQLTGAANRALFRDRADHALKRANRNRKPVAVLYCDLDNLKETNDRLGHEVGDKLLAAVAQRFAGCIRAEDTVARLGGDEFAVLLTDSGGEGAARHIAQRLLDALAEPFKIDGHAVRTTASIGIALSWGRQAVDDLLRNADLAMYAAKNRGKARYELFESSVHGAETP